MRSFRKRTHIPKLEIEDFNLNKETLKNISSGIVSDHFSGTQTQ
jgi:2-oxoglutarate dehydrogenase E1 component